MKIPSALHPALLAVLLPLSSLHATTWTGLGDGLTWEDASNWDTGLPGGTDVVLTRGGASVTLSSVVNIAMLYLGITPVPPGTSTLTVAAGGVIEALDSSGIILTHSRIGGIAGPGALRLERGSAATFWLGLSFGGPNRADATLEYFGSGADFSDQLNLLPMGIAPDADDSSPTPSIIRWNFHIDRDEAFTPITCDQLQLSTTTSAHPNSIRLDILPAGDPFQVGDSFPLVDHAFFYTGTFLTPNGSAAIPEAGSFTTGDATFRIDYNIAGIITATVVATVDSPDLVVEEPTGTAMSSGENRDFGSGLPGATSAPKTFVIRNDGAVADLSTLEVTITGTHAADFNLDATGLSPLLAPGADTSFSVTFTPSAAGVRSATLSITSNDPDENPFLIPLSGTGLTPLTLAQEAYFKASNTGADDWFGVSVAIAGDTVVVGAYLEDSNATGIDGDQANNNAVNSGAAYIFVRSGGTWSQQAYLKASNTGAGDSFGRSVAISGDTVVVGAYLEDSSATGANGDQNNEGTTDSGAAYIFVRNGTTWSQQAYLKASNTGPDDWFGRSVVISGATVVVGAPKEASSATGIGGNQADDSADTSGAAYVFVRRGTNWNQQAYLKASNTGDFDYFAWSIAIAGDTLVVGAPYESSNALGIDGNQLDDSATHAGAAYVFVRGGDAWSQQAYLKASNTGADDLFGNFVAVSVETVVVGAPWEDSSATGIDGDQLNESSVDSGAAYVFVRDGELWSQQSYLKASNTDAGDLFGLSTAISGETLLVGAHQEDSSATGLNGDQSDNGADSSGAAYAFVRDGTTWSQQAYLKASNTGAGDLFSSHVAISGDTLVLGAPLEDSSAAGIDGDQADNGAPDSGAAYIFTGLPPSAPVIIAEPTPDQTIAGGTSTSLTVEAIGNPFPTFQWYAGSTGDTSAPLPGATGSSFTTPPLVLAANFWVRATNGSGFADSDTATINIGTSSNANLAELIVSGGTLDPAFDPAISSYLMSVPHDTFEITVSPTTEDPAATMQIYVAGFPVPSGEPVILDPGENYIEIFVTASDGFNWKYYSVTVYQEPRTIYWDGGGDGEYWEDPDNWDIDELPEYTDDVFILTGGEVLLSSFDFVEINSLNLQSGELYLEGDAYLEAYSYCHVGGSGGEPSVLTIEHSYGGWAMNGPGLIFGGPLGGDAILNDYGSGSSFGELGIDSLTDDEIDFQSLVRWNFFIDREGGFLPLYAYDVTLETDGSSTPNAVVLDIEPSGDPFHLGDTFTLIEYSGGSVTGRFMTPEGDAIEDGGTFVSEGYTFLIDYEDGEAITAQVVGLPPELPVITTQPTASQAIPLGATATLSVTAGGDPAPDFQWYRGESGQTFSPIAGATSSSYTTPAMDGSAEYWVRATNVNGYDDSQTAVVIVISSDADLVNLVPSTGFLQPFFNHATTNYTMVLSHAFSELQVYPMTSARYATVQVNGAPVSWGDPSDPISLEVGDNTITVVVRATDGVTTKTYEIVVTRAEQTVVWDGGGDGSGWFDPLNWSFDLVPIWGDDVSISTLESVVLPNFSYGEVRSLDLRAGELALDMGAELHVSTTERIGGAGEGPATLTLRGQNGWTFTQELIFGGAAGGEAVLDNHGYYGSYQTLGIDPMADHDAPAPSPIRWNFHVDRSTFFSPLYAAELALETVGSANPNAIRLDIMPSGEPFELNDSFTLANYSGGSVMGRFLTPDGLAVIGDDTSFDSGGYTFEIDYDDGVTITATVVDIPSGIPVITTEPVAEQTVERGTSVTLTVEATSDPAPTYQWYAGSSGNLSTPIAGATSDRFTTPPITSTSTFWVQVTGSTDSVNSDTATIFAVEFANADLSGLLVSPSSLTPVFNPALTEYSVMVGNPQEQIYVRPVAAEPTATIEVNGTVVSSGFWSNPISLALGTTPVTVLVRALDGTTTKTYSLAVTRLEPTLLATGPATGIGSTAATVTGTITPNDSVNVYFEYGPDTGYGSTTFPQFLSGTEALDIEAALSGLEGNTTYHYRIVSFGSGGLLYGPDASFSTLPTPPVAATGNAVAVSDTGATLVGAVNPHGLPTEVYFEYGLTELYGNTTPVEIVPAGSGLTDVLAPVSGLLTGGTYYYRLVARSAAGTDESEGTTFVATAGTSTGTGVPTAAPTVTTADAWNIEPEAAMLRGTVNGNGGTTVVWFEYGTSTAYGQVTAEQGIGNSDTAATLSLSATGLLPDTEYHYRVLASNSLGVSPGIDRTFRSASPAPLATTGETELLSTTSVRALGEVRALDTNAQVWIDYGTSPSLLVNSVRATPGTVTGNEPTAISANLNDLVQTVRYYYQVRALDPANPDRIGRGAIRSFSVAALSGLAQEYPSVVPPGERDGEVTMSFTPGGVPGGWRFRGERTWRTSGESATGLTDGDRTIEFRPVPGFLQPEPETVAVISGNPPQVLERAYTASAAPGSGDLIVNLKPESLADPANPVESRAQWRLLGESDAQWRNSGDPLTELVPGDYIIECKPIAGRTTPPLLTARVQDGLPTLATATYFLADPPGGTPPGVLSFPQISVTSLVPYPFVGQIRSDVGSSTGFVVRPGVVATAGHVVFDDGTLEATSGLQWLFQRHRGIHEPTPQPPRGFYLLSGYAEQRAIENTPGESSPESQNLDAAALYFLEDPGRSGFSGFLASDSEENEFLLSSAMKTLVGYPIDGIAAADLNRMHATPPADVTFAPAFGQTYTTSGISTSGGSSGGPLCVLHGSGSYYPAAIYLGGTGQTVVRAIDSEVLALFGFAEASSIPGGDNTGGTATLATSPIGTPALGALEVFIEPAEARGNGAGWRINSQENYLPSGTRLDDLTPRSDYGLQFASIPGFLPPTSQLLEIRGGELLTVTFTYEVRIPAPVITSAGVVSGTKGDALDYQISATNSPESYSLAGSLPSGVSFNEATGSISGTLDEAGRFDVTVSAANAGGADNRTVTITSSPVLADQEFTGPAMVLMNYAIVSGESGTGVSYDALGLPEGLSLDPATGVISGIPESAGVYPVPISVTRREAGATATLTLNITGDAPVLTLDLPASRAVEYGLSTLLTVAAEGTPAPDFQWYEGPAGDVSKPITGATEATFTTPPITAPVSFWARAISISGMADSSATDITVLPSTNARLSNLVVDAAPLNPPFNANILDYAMVVPDFFSSVVVTPYVQIDRSSVEVDGLPVSAGTQSDPVPLAPGANTITVRVTADDGIAATDYTITITRSDPPVATTEAPSAVDDTSATLHGTVTPNGPATVFFQYGPTTDYGKATPSQTVTGASPLAIQRTLAALSADTLYHYRIVLTTSGGTTFTGEDQTFLTGPPRPVAATSSPVGVTTAEATLTGAVIPMARDTTVYFEYGPTATYDSRTADQVFPAGTSVRDVTASITGLTPSAFYHYRIVAISTAGSARGEDIEFKAVVGTGAGDGIPDAPPTVTTGAVSDLTPTSARLLGLVNPNDGTTLAYFEYGPTAAYGFTTPGEGKGNGSIETGVNQPIEGLVPGTLYHYRLVASNSLGETQGSDATFKAGFLPPIATSGGAEPITATSARITGTVRARGADTQVHFDYGTDPTGVAFPFSILAGNVGGDTERTMSADLINLEEGITYYYRTRATSSGGTTSGEVRPLSTWILLGFQQQFSRELPLLERDGRLMVNLLPAGRGGWHFVGETAWRPPGQLVTGLLTGERQIEFQPVPGSIQPLPEIVSVVSGGPITEFSGTYYDGSSGSGAIRVVLLPESSADPGLPVADRAQWRLLGHDDTTWRDSGFEWTGLEPGNHIVVCKPIGGQDAPPAGNLVVEDGESSAATRAYLPTNPPTLYPPQVLPIETTSTSEDFPYAYVGQIRSATGSYSGFVVKPRVVATVAQAIYDDTTLEVTQGLQWILQRDHGSYEPEPQVPRGFYTIDDYASQRSSEATPGIFGLPSQNSNVAALYFSAEAGRGGFGGYLASDAANNEFLESDASKILVGYPVHGISPSKRGRMHTTIPRTAAFGMEFDRVYSSPAIQGGGGFIGGPLCVQYEGGAYYPAAIHVGGGAQSFVRSIDTPILDLFFRAAISANGGDNNTSGGISHTSFSAFGAPAEPGKLKISIEPAGALAEVPGWEVLPEPGLLPSGSTLFGLPPGSYRVKFRSIPGYGTPVVQDYSVLGGSLTEVVFTYPPAASELDDWRLAHFGPTLPLPPEAADDQDPDRDGITNYHEFVAKTDPNDPNDFFRIASAEHSGASFTTSLTGRAGRRYELQRSTTLGPDSWTTVASQARSLADGDAAISLTDPAAPGTAAYYRVRVSILEP